MSDAFADVAKMKKIKEDIKAQIVMKMANININDLLFIKTDIIGNT